MKVAVVGAGVMGLSVANSLVDAGAQVTVFEPFDHLHNRGSSHGSSRIVRVAYIDRFYAEIMLRTMPIWRAWQALSERQFLHEVGIVYLGEVTSPDLVCVRDALRSLGQDPRILGAHTFDNLITDLRFLGMEGCIHAVDGGWVDADQVRRFLWERISGRVEWVQERIRNLEALSQQFDRVVLCVGCWAKEFCNWTLVPRLQTVAYFEGTHTGPVWIDASGDMMYGFPSERGRTDFKVGIHHLGTDFDPEEFPRKPDSESLDRLTDYVKARFGIKKPEDYSDRHVHLHNDRRRGLPNRLARRAGDASFPLQWTRFQVCTLYRRPREGRARWCSTDPRAFYSPVLSLIFSANDAPNASRRPHPR